MIKTLQSTLKQDREKYKIPKSVQDIIPIRRIWQDGIFQAGSKFSKSIRFTDINYAIASKEDKTSMFLRYSELLNALDTGATTKVTIHNRHLNRQHFEETILLPEQGDRLDGYRQEYNQMLTEKVTGTVNNVVQERYITISVHRKNVEEARTFFARVSNDVLSKLTQLDAHSEELDAVQRLQVLHDFYRPGEEADFHLNLRELMRRGHAFQDSICPDTMEMHKDHFVMGNCYGRVLFLKDFASYTQRGLNTCRLWAAISGAFCRSLIGGRQPTCFANAKNPSKMPRPQVLRSQGRIHFRPDKKKAAGNIGHIAKAFSAVWAEMNLP